MVKLVARVLGPGEAVPREIRAAVSPLTLERLHPGADDASMASWYVTTVDDPAEGERVAMRLRSLPDVEAAYVEPPSAPPA
jgi:hypothetical protein